MKDTLHGYMTLEAALLMPAVWFTVFFLIFAGFFQYDRCIAEQDGRLLAIRAAEMRGKDEAAVIRTEMEKGELAGKKKLLFGEGVHRDLYVTRDKAKITINGRVNTLLKGLLKEGNLNAFSYAIEYEAKRYDPVQFIRTCRRVGKYGGI